MNPTHPLQNFYEADLSSISFISVLQCTLARFLRSMKSQVDRYVRNLKKRHIDVQDTAHDHGPFNSTGI